MGTHAWPYAVSRDEQFGYQAVVVPEFLAHAGQAYVLEYASKGQASQPGTVMVREIRGAVIEPLSLAYRVTETVADRGESDGHDVPAYRAGRTMRRFEGLVLQASADQVASLGLNVADLDAVASVTDPAFGKLRAAETPVEAQPSTAISIADLALDARLLDLQMAKPYVVPGAESRPEPAEARSGRGLIVAAVIVGALAVLLVWYLLRLVPHSG